MSRRRFVAIVSAGVMLTIGFLVLAAFLAVTQTDLGRERVRRFLNARLASAMGKRGSMYVGRIHGSLFTEVVVDSFSIRDAEDSLFVATGPVRIQYDPRDILDKRIFISRLEVSHPVVNLRRHADRVWNFKMIFPGGPSTPRTPERKYGDYIVIEHAVLHDGTVVVTEPWSPPDSLTGARRDSAIRFAYTDSTHDVRPTREGPKQSRRWTHIELQAPHVRIADPDSAGRFVQVGSLAAIENDPPFHFRNVSGPVRIQGDSVWLTLHHFDLPGSTGSASGKVWWGGDQPVNYAVDVVGDSVSLADVAWVYPTLPRTGGGRLELRIRNNERDKHVLEYALSKLDVRSTHSRLLGSMTFGVGGPTLVVKNLNLDAEPIDFDFLRTLNGGPFPVDWQGQFFGTVKGPGGPVNRFVVDEAKLTFHDQHVPDAVSRFTGSGGLDILKPAQARFRGFDLDVATLDLRSIETLFPNFPRLRGTISGSARLDSIWTDVRFSHADITHRDGPALPTHVMGSGRITYGERYLGFDVDLQADPLSFSDFARSYPRLALRGPFVGPLRIKGTMDNLALASTLTGAPGTMAVDGTFDLDTLGGLGGRGTLRMSDLDVGALLERRDLPAMRLTGSASGNVTGSSVSTLAGTLAVALAPSRVGAVRFDSSVAMLSFGDGRVRVDSMAVTSSAASGTARGALGLRPGVVDSLRYTVVVDTLGGLRPWIRAARAAPPAADSDSALTEDALDQRRVRDSIVGTLRTDGLLVGSIDTLSARGTFDARELFMGGNLAQHVSGTYAFAGLPHDARGAVSGRGDSLLVGTVPLDSITATLAMLDRAHGRLTMALGTTRALGTFAGGAAVEFARSGDTLAVSVDTLGATIQGHPWRLVTPAHVWFDTIGTHLDSVLVRNAGGAMAALRGDFPNTAPVNASLVLDSIPLDDMGALAQTRRPLGGAASGTLQISGPRQSPSMRLSARFDELKYGTVSFPYFTMTGTYGDRRLEATVDVLRKEKTVLAFTGSLPVDLALAPRDQRLRGDSLRGRLAADSLDLAILETVTPLVASVSGTMSMGVDIGGTFRHPTLAGRVRVHDGEVGLPRVGIRLTSVNGDVQFTRDSVRIAQLSMSSGAVRGNYLRVSGAVRLGNLADLGDNLSGTAYDLSMAAQNFQLVDRRAFARMEITDSLRLTGPFTRLTLSGTVYIPRATFFISDLARKNVIDIDSIGLVDTTFGFRQTGFAQRADVREMRDHLRVSNFTVAVGNEVWLRSAEANIKLGGQVDIARDTSLGGSDVGRLVGSLNVERGTYRLDLGLVQRTFQVDEGTVTFYNDPEQAGTLDIWATYTVRQANQLAQDVRIRAHILGTMLNPRLELVSDERFPLSYTEILSYLVFGQPSLFSSSDIANNNALRPVAAALLPSAGALIERALTSQIGFFDLVQIQTGSTQDVQSLNVGAQNVLAGSRIGLGKQIGENTFITANAGLCRLSSSNTNASFSSSIGVTVEHRLNDHLSVQASSEPSTASLVCKPGATDIGNRPRQYGFDLFREWTF